MPTSTTSTIYMPGKCCCPPIDCCDFANPTVFATPIGECGGCTWSSITLTFDPTDGAWHGSGTQNGVLFTLTLTCLPHSASTLLHVVYSGPGECSFSHDHSNGLCRDGDPWLANYSGFDVSSLGCFTCAPFTCTIGWTLSN